MEDSVISKKEFRHGIGAEGTDKKMDFVFGILIITLILTAPGQFCEQKKEKIKD